MMKYIGLVLLALTAPAFAQSTSVPNSAITSAAASASALANDANNVSTSAASVNTDAKSVAANATSIAAKAGNKTVISLAKTIESQAAMIESLAAAISSQANTINTQATSLSNTMLAWKQGSPPTCTINSVSLSNSSFIGGSASGTNVGAISVGTSGTCGSAVLSLSGTDAASFQISGSSLETNGTVAAGTYSINIVATISGAGGSPLSQPETITGTSSGSCPQGSGLADGCAGAQTSGIMPYPHLADLKQVVMLNIIAGSGYTNHVGYAWTSTGGGCSPAASGTVDVVNGGFANGVISNAGTGCTSRPSIALPSGSGGGSGASITPSVYQKSPHNAATTYNLPGVDYPVGYDRTLTLKDPTAGGQLPGCASYSSPTVTITASNCTLNGFDFTLHSTLLNVNPNLSNVLITNNKFQDSANSSSNYNLVLKSGGTCGTTIKYNDFGGNAVPGTGSGFSVNSEVAFQCTGGSVVFEYNYCYNEDSKCIYWQGGSTVSITEKYNLYSAIGLCSNNCSHGEIEYAYSAGIASPWIIQFNTALAPWNPMYLGSLATSVMAVEADSATIKNADVEYNFVLAPGPWLATGSDNSNIATAITASAPMYCGYQEGGSNTGGVMLHNYFDYTGAFFPFNGSSGTCGSSFPSESDINPVTGNVCSMSGSCN